MGGRGDRDFSLLISLVMSKTKKLEIKNWGFRLLKHGSGWVNCKWVGRLVGYVNMLKF